MRIIGVDLHTRQQTVAMLDTATGELVKKTLKHDGDEVRKFYSALPGQVLAGIASHPTRLLGTLTPRSPEWIDGLTNHCHDEDKLPAARVGAGRTIPQRILRIRIWQFRSQN